MKTPTGLVLLVVLGLVVLPLAIPAVSSRFQLVQPFQHPFSIPQNPHSPLAFLCLKTSRNTFAFSPTDITALDDVYQGAETLHFTEWWYFDAILSNDYSVELTFQILDLLDQQVLMVKINMYNAGVLIKSDTNIYTGAEYNISTETPLIQIQGVPVMIGTYTNGKWSYQVSYELKDVAVSLQYTGTMKGWKGSVPVGEWIVPLPKADVDGSIRINKKTYDVEGVGYHDHNTAVTLQVSTYFGWYWGKIQTSNLSVIWSALLMSRFDVEPLLVLNTEDHSYVNIPSDDIKIEAADFTMENGKLVPHFFTIQTKTSKVDIQLDVTVETMHHVKLGLLNYWRYHVTCQGFVRYGSIQEQINQKQIHELIRFR